ncbi:MAG TPA: VOC family protein [Opitutus sp.]|nr:VOC family protein [Opitutus sp.]
MFTKSIAPVFRVRDLDSALDHYVNVLGFSADFRYGNYAGVKLGTILLHLTGGPHTAPVGVATAYIYCEHVDQYHAALASRGAAIESAPRDWPYGMREFFVADPDGNRLGFGCQLESA